MLIKREDFISQIKVLGNLYNAAPIFPQSTIFTVVKSKTNIIIKYFDGTTYAESSLPNVNQDDEITLNIECKNFLTLLNKLSSEEIELVINPTELIIQTGNNKYSFPNTDIGTPIQDNPYTNTNFDKVFTVDEATIEDIVKYNTNALSIDPQQKQKNHFLLNTNECIATNYVIISFYLKQFPEQVLLDSRIIKSIAGLGDCKVEISNNKDFIKYTCKNTLVFSPFIEITQDGYEVDSIIQVKNLTYPDKVKINKAELLESMDRLMIFNGKDNKSLIFNFEENKLKLTNINQHNYEDVNYLDNTKCNNQYKYFVNYENLCKECNTLTEKDLEFNIGNDNFMCIKTDKVIKIIALSEES